MKAASVLGAMLAIAVIADVADAAPHGFYNPVTGGISLTNDTGATLGAISVISATNSVKTDPSLFTAIPGATFDPGDLPLGFTYLSFPPTNNAFGWYVGNVIKPGTFVGDLSGVYYESLSTGVAKPFYFIFPEPASGGIVLWAGSAMLAASRRRRS